MKSIQDIDRQYASHLAVELRAGAFVQVVQATNAARSRRITDAPDDFRFGLDRGGLAQSENDGLSPVQFDEFGSDP